MNHLSKIAFLFALVGHFAMAGVAIQPPNTVEVSCIDWLGVQLTFTQYSHNNTVYLNYADGRQRTGFGALSRIGTGRVHVQETAKNYTLYYSGSQLMMQITRLGEAPGYGYCNLN